MTDLAELGERYKTDKFNHGYLPLYEKYLQGREIRSVLEIGVLDGRSLRMWRQRFPHAQIYGLDIEPDCQKRAGHHIKVYTGSQDDPAVLAEIIEDSRGFDVVVDDGSHVNSLTIKSFVHLWPHTRQLYVIEDLACSYVDLTPHVASWPGMHHNQGVSYRNRRDDMDTFFGSLIRRVDQGEMELHFHRDLAFVERT